MAVLLRDYQQECIDNIVAEARNGVQRQVVVLATGLGKTVIFGHLPSLVKAKGKKTLILAHREELLEQAKDKIHWIDPTLKIEIEQGERQVFGDVDVVIASVPTIGRADGKRIQKFNPEDFGLIIIDECHRSCAESYMRVLEYFDVLKGKVKKPNGRILLGVTATPSRSDHQGLDKIYDKITFAYPLRKGIENGYLANIKAFSVDTATDISKVHTRGGDFIDSELSDAINNDERNQLIVESYKELTPDTKALVFASSVEHTKELTQWFIAGGIEAEYVLGETDKNIRRETLKKFKDGALKVLVNCAVLTEGFDEPSIETILMARPTKSSVAYAQMIGRGTRLYTDKLHLNLIDFVDNTGKNQIASLPSLFGLEKVKLRGGKKGKFIMDVVTRAEKVLEANPNYPIEHVDDWSDEGIEKVIKQVDIFSQAELSEEVKENSKYSWETSFEGYKIQFPEDKIEFLAQGSAPLPCREQVTIKKNMLDHYQIRQELMVQAVPSFQNGYKKWEKARDVLIAEVPSLAEAFKKGDEWIADKKPQFSKMLNQESKWRSDQPTDKQKDMLKKFNIPTPKGLTKGQASVLIGKAISERNKFRANY